MTSYYKKYMKYKMKYNVLKQSNMIHVGGTMTVDLVDYDEKHVDTLKRIEPALEGVPSFVSNSDRILTRYKLGCFVLFKMITIEEPEKNIKTPIGMITSKWKNKKDMGLNGYETIYMIQNITIDHHYQGKGYGTQALNQFIKISKDKYNLQEIYISSKSISALKLYLKLGFKFIEGHKIDGINDIENKYEAVMMKEL
jgi:RimJ/RimL family protein N-acetyltransferase